MKKINLINLIFNIYLFLFIFTMIDREFLFLGLDLRMLNLMLGVILIFIKLIRKDEQSKNDFSTYDRNAKIIFAFFVWIFISNISWFWNGLDINFNKFAGQIILIINNFFAIVVFYQYKDKINQDKVNKMVVFSCMILAVSFAFVAAGYELKDISGSDVRSKLVASKQAPDHKNIFGGNYRLAGYAEDPNYASIFFVIGAVSVIQLKMKKTYKVVFGSIFAICLGFACSKTILLSCIVAIAYLIVSKYIQKRSFKQLINASIIVSVLIVSIVFPRIQSFSMLSTMETRFKMWNMASDMFMQSPIIGNGINSFKSYINEQNNGRWYVQVHSTYWQTIAETGIIGICFLSIILYNLLNKENGRGTLFLTLLYILFAINFETIQLQLFVYIICVIQIAGTREEIKERNEKSIICS